MSFADHLETCSAKPDTNPALMLDLKLLKAGRLYATNLTRIVYELSCCPNNTSSVVIVSLSELCCPSADCLTSGTCYINISLSFTDLSPPAIPPQSPLTVQENIFNQFYIPYRKITDEKHKSPYCLVLN